MATIGASAKAKANRHLSAGRYGTTIEAGTLPTSKKQTDCKRKSGTSTKVPMQQKSALRTEGSFLKGKGKDASKPKKQARFEAEAGSESD